MLKEVLVNEAKLRGLSTSGKKAELLERLREYASRLGYVDLFVSSVLYAIYEFTQPHVSMYHNYSLFCIRIYSRT